MSGNENLSGRVLAGKYQLGRMLGQGGMGAVYEARNHLGKRVAVKMLLEPSFAQDPQLAARFFREAKASAAIESRHIVEVYDTGVDEASGISFIIMEHLSGEDVDHLLRRVGALAPAAAVRVIIQAATGLAKAHEAGIIHRDIKPANLFLVEREGELTVKILDFGIAKLASHGLAALDPHEAGLTSTGSLLGTPLYMSPEQAQGLKSIDARTDIWSLGMVLYQLLCGQTPFGDVDTIGKLIVAIVSRDLVPLHRHAPWVSEGLAEVARRAIARDVQHRIPSARALIELLAPYAEGSSTLSAAMLTGSSVLASSSSIPSHLATATIGREHLESPSLPKTTGSTTRDAMMDVAETPSMRKPPWRTLAMIAVVLCMVALGGAYFARSTPAAGRRADRIGEVLHAASAFGGGASAVPTGSSAPSIVSEPSAVASVDAGPTSLAIAVSAPSVVSPRPVKPTTAGKSLSSAIPSSTTSPAVSAEEPFGKHVF